MVLVGRRVMKYTIENVNGYSTENDWGVMGTNLIKDLYIDKCVLNRVDVHFQAWNVTIKNSDNFNACSCIKSKHFIS